MADVLILPTGTANLASVEAAFKKLGASTARAEDPETITEAARVVLPGVGTFGATMAGLEGKSFAKPIAERVKAGKPTLSMCVGLQVLFETSDESPDAQGLAVIEGKVGRFPRQRQRPPIRLEPHQGRGGLPLLGVRLRLLRQQLPGPGSAWMPDCDLASWGAVRRRPGAG